MTFSRDGLDALKKSMSLNGMEKYALSRGRGRTKVSLQAQSFGSDLVLLIYNENAHIGAVAVGEYDFEHERASVSVITRLGHKDDAVAQQAAYLVSRSLKKPVCVIAGIHLDDITRDEIERFVENATLAVESFIKSIKKD
ncbi:MAG: hypothetical protein A2144_09470 [Chloroflexi bacterium RBG_16_50_9]|nr:MAG: hypothetical protein A2144_09470 [Chloroflexi bacterium RBG_16_50_9]